METKELMEYIDDLEKKKVRDETIKEKIKNLVDKLNTLKISTSFSYNQITKLRGNLKEDPLNKDEYSDYSFIPNLQFYFDSNDNFVSLMNEQTSLLSNFIGELIDRVDSIKDDLDEGKLKEMESQKTTEGESKEKEDEKKPEVQNGEEILDEVYEEEEEVAVNIPNYLFECEDCGNKFPHAYMGGCRKCGEHIFRVSYL